MNYLKTILVALVGTGFSLFAQDANLAVTAIPVELLTDAQSVVRDYSLHYRVNSANEAIVTVRRVVTILEEEHGTANRLVVHYNDDAKITRFKATLYDAAGEKVRSAKKSEIEDVLATGGGNFYDDHRIQTTVLTHLSTPYTVAFEYERKDRNFNIVGFPEWMPMAFDQSVQSASFVAEVPLNNELLFRTNELPDPAVSEEDGRRKYQWKVSDLPARRAEPEAPPARHVLPLVRTGLKNFAVGEYQGSMTSWRDFGDFMRQLYSGQDELPPNLLALVHETTDHLTTDREKIAALYRLLQVRTRYVSVQLGIGGWQPFPAAYVEENRYGDCKALSNYMGAMLREIDITSYPVICFRGQNEYYPVGESFVTSAFNHVILYVPSEEMYLECTSNVSPPGYLGIDKDDRNVLWVTPEGGNLVRTPATTAADNGRLRTVKVQVRKNGDAAVSIDAKYHGASQEYFRHFLHAEQDPAKQREYLNRREDIPDVTGKEFSFACAPESPVASLHYATVLPGYARKMGKRFFVPINKLYNYDWIPDQLSERQFPVYDKIARFYVDTVHLTLPADLEIESLGEKATHIRHAAGEYRAEIRQPAADKLTWVRTLKLNSVNLPPEEYAGYRQFFVDVAKADRRQIVVREKKTK